MHSHFKRHEINTNPKINFLLIENSKRWRFLIYSNHISYHYNSVPQWKKYEG